MRIQARLFAGTGALLLAVMAAQWWLHQRQLQTIEHELGTVAASVGQGALVQGLMFSPEVVGDPVTEDEALRCFVEHAAEAQPEVTTSASEAGGAPADPTHTTMNMVLITETEGSDGVTHRLVREHVLEGDDVKVKWVADDEAHVTLVGAVPPAGDADAADGTNEVTHRIELRVVPGEKQRERFLVVQRDEGEETRIPIPVSSAMAALDAVHRQGYAISTAVLAIGLVASGVLARRVARPLQRLARGAERLAGGDLGTQVLVTGSGEVGELERAFNHMSVQLAELEAEREGWRRREHLAQLGDLARGLAHTVRNPLNTLGLVVEELAERSGAPERLVETSRGQIRRIDRWLRSFLALGAGDAAVRELVDLNEAVQAVVLEALQHGAPVRLETSADPVPVRVVPTALRAALANLLENAVEASPPGEAVEVRVTGGGGRAEVELRDRGAGLPQEVRERLYSPHVTTKVEGSGMGLFLARELVVTMHGGELSLTDGSDGGTVARVTLPRAEGEGGA